MTILNNKKNMMFFVIVFFVLMLLVDRFYWAQISQWREDQATNIWLGYTAKIGEMPIGLISSRDIPNPNGMLLLGSVLSILPNLLSVSFFLGIIQMILLVLVGWESFGRNWQYFLLATIPSLSSVILRSISVELWNQYAITLINIFYIFWAVRYLKNQSLWNLPPIVALILLAPSMYLAGIVNAIVMSLLSLGILLYKRPNTKGLGYVLSVTLLLVVISILLTWLPYYHNVGLEQIADYNKTKLGPVAMIQTAWEAQFGFPIYATFQWADKARFSAAFKHADLNIISASTNSLLRSVGRIYMLQAIFAFLAFTYTTFAALSTGNTTNSLGWKINSSVSRVVVVSGIFISLSYTFSGWLGGPAWINGERLDQVAQFLPMFLLVIFLLPFVINIGGKTRKIIDGISYFSLALFCMANLSCGYFIIRDHLQYRGNILSEADIPLINKMNAVDFIVGDWKKHSDSNIIPVDYDLGGGRWDWVSEFGITLTKWYPSPMTEGRSFDYELLRRYGLTNQQEGVQHRSFGNSRYLVTYAFEDPPLIAQGKIAHYIFGRLRVSIVEK